MSAPQPETPPDPYLRPEPGRHRLDRVALYAVPPVAEHPPIQARRRLADLLEPLPAGLVFLAGAAFGTVFVAILVSFAGPGEPAPAPVSGPGVSVGD
jgi:hypothetical protein